MSNVIIGTLRTTSNGHWFELADESAGVDACTFESVEDAEAALAELGWRGDIHEIAYLESIGVEL